MSRLKLTLYIIGVRLDYAITICTYGGSSQSFTRPESTWPPKFITLWWKWRWEAPKFKNLARAQAIRRVRALVQKASATKAAHKSSSGSAKPTKHETKPHAKSSKPDPEKSKHSRPSSASSGHSRCMMADQAQTDPQYALFVQERDRGELRLPTDPSLL